MALTVIQRRSSNGSNKRQLDTLRSLGLRRIGHAVQVDDCPQSRGMLHAVRHLVEVHADSDSAKGAARTEASK
jgi:large subunit ribosomal protein L30